MESDKIYAGMVNAKNIHIIGLGGIGTSAVARFFLAKGAKVSGSDIHSSSIVEDLQREGVDFRLGHFAENVPRECDLIVYSRAVPADNVERQMAAERGIAVCSYPEFLGELASHKKTIAISGTNGKSTTTAMIATIFIEAGLDPTVIVGTQVPGWEKHNLRLGESEWFIVEACEHMASMLHIQPDIAIITNIAEDHLDFYRDMNEIVQTFQKWVSGMKDTGVCLINAQDPESQKIEFDRVATFEVKDRHIDGEYQSFTVDKDPYRLMIPGEFNAQNAAAAVVAAKQVGIKPGVIAKGLEKFKGTWRRFEHIGMWKGVDIYSDYAHHPDAICGAIEAFKEAFPNRRLIVVFEPHQYSRTKELLNEFAKSFDKADMLILSEIYEVAGRGEDKDVSSKDILDAIHAKGKVLPNAQFAENHDQVHRMLEKCKQPRDVIVFMGAGGIDNLARKLMFM